jgi:hypothetical protein
MKPLRVIWDIDDDPFGNVQHIAQHGLTKDDVQSVFDGPEDEDISRATGQPMVFGTISDGRYIAVVYEQVDADSVYPITDYEVR